MKRIGKIIGVVLALLVIVGGIYYVTLPAINIHSSSFWFFIMLVFVIIIILNILRKDGNRILSIENNELQFHFKELKKTRILIVLLALTAIIYAVGSILSSPIINAKKYQQLLKVTEGNFTEDIAEVDYRTIPLLDKESASLLGDRKMGGLVNMVSQFEVANDYTQINLNDKPVRVTPLIYADTIKWFTNQAKGIPGYILIDMATQDTQVVMVEEGIKYSKSEHLNRNLYRHLRFRYPTYIFDDQIFFEIDDEGTPYWVCPVKQFNIGLFGGQTIGKVVLCNAITGETIEYKVEDVPTWVDKVYSAELLTTLYNYYGVLKNGYFNSILGQRDCLKTTNGYNYIALEDDVWVYTGITSVSGDQSNVGFVLMNQRTMETKYYKVEGAIEDSAMSSAQGQVQNLGYKATFPLLLNIQGEPTYFMALKDDSGLVKKYAMVNVQKYQWVAIGDTVQECEKNYNSLLNTNGIVSENIDAYKTASGEIEYIAPIVLEGTTHYYFGIVGNNEIFDINLSNEELLSILKKKEGDTINVTYLEGYGISAVRSIE
ncbi:MAG: CvpA family protein [Lachnospiraceae bacterium]